MIDYLTAHPKTLGGNSIYTYQDPGTSSKIHTKPIYLTTGHRALTPRPTNWSPCFLSRPSPHSPFCSKPSNGSPTLLRKPSPPNWPLWPLSTALPTRPRHPASLSAQASVSAIHPPRPPGLEYSVPKPRVAIHPSLRSLLNPCRTGGSWRAWTPPRHRGALCPPQGGEICKTHQSLSLVATWQKLTALSPPRL